METSVASLASHQGVVEFIQEVLAHGAMGAAGEPLHESQKEALGTIGDFLASGGKLCHIVMPGGSGKTRIGLALARGAFTDDRQSLFVVPSQEALTDFAAKAGKLFRDMDIGKVYEGEKRIGNVTFITYVSLLRRVLGEETTQDMQEQARLDHEYAESHGQSLPPADLRIDPRAIDLVIWDEAHMYLSEKAQDLRTRFGHAVNIGMTATPRYYEGKDVSDHFGKRIYELPMALAKKRGEICDYEPVLVGTNQATGITLTSPEREESPTVVRALNRLQRNQMVADIYADMKAYVPRKKKDYRLLGEPALAFGGSVQHVNDIADAINAALMPRLKNDPEFRAVLRGKGIDPDKVEQIAAPIYSGRGKQYSVTPQERDVVQAATNDELREELRARGGDPDHIRRFYDPMPLDKRKALIKKYHDRKVLMLVSTSLLQQSFDSPMTSVVIDTIPRQTFVGCGQAGMRATRPGKEMAFIVNMEDQDHTSISFREFDKARQASEEEGVKVGLIVPGHGGRHYHSLSKPQIDDGSAPQETYTITSGGALTQLVDERLKAVQNRREEADAREAEKKLVAEREVAESRDEYRHSQEEKKQLRDLTVEIKQGKPEALNQLREALLPWLYNTQERFVRKLREKDPDFSEEAAKNAKDWLEERLLYHTAQLTPGSKFECNDYDSVLQRINSRIGDYFIGRRNPKQFSMWPGGRRGPKQKQGYFSVQQLTPDHERLLPAHRDVDPLEREEIRQGMRTLIDHTANPLQKTIAESLLREHTYARIASLNDCPEGTIGSAVKRFYTRSREALIKKEGRDWMEQAQEALARRGKLHSSPSIIQHTSDPDIEEFHAQRVKQDMENDLGYAGRGLRNLLARVREGKQSLAALMENKSVISWCNAVFGDGNLEVNNIKYYLKAGNIPESYDYLRRLNQAIDNMRHYRDHKYDTKDPHCLQFFAELKKQEALEREVAQWREDINRLLKSFWSSNKGVLR